MSVNFGCTNHTPAQFQGAKPAAAAPAANTPQNPGQNVKFGIIDGGICSIPAAACACCAAPALIPAAGVGGFFAIRGLKRKIGSAFRKAGTFFKEKVPGFNKEFKQQKAEAAASQAQQSTQSPD